MHSVILYYKYIRLEKPETVTLWQKELCKRLNLTGRVIIAAEGINGTLEGATKNIKEYMKITKTLGEFSDIKFKMSEGDGKSFPKLTVRTRSEIVTLGRPNLFPVPSKTGGDYISADKLHELLEKKDDVVILDMRNDYEAAVGKFENSVVLPVRNFREIPGKAEELKKLKDKKVVAVCTGGVRCEKGTAYLKEELGFKNVSQLHDGIVTYMNKYPKGHFKGGLYVFDGRMVFRSKGMPNEVIGSCVFCKKPSEKFVNCSHTSCKEHFVVCSTCLDKSDTKGRIQCVACSGS